MHLDPKGLEAAELALSEVLKDWHYVMPTDGMDRVIRAYISASIPAEIGGLVEQLRARCSYGDARLWQKHDPLSEQAASALLSLSARVGELEKALGPFAEDGEMFGRPDKYQRAARAVLDADEMAETSYRARLRLGRTYEGGNGNG